MLRISKLFILILLSLFIVNFAQAYQLVWSDEFSSPNIDQAKWGYDIGGNGWGNNELESYTDRSENSYIDVENGWLVIQALNEVYTGADGIARDYTSARMVTRNKADFRYGKIEARIKVPAGQGFWPAFWMMPTDSEYGGWAASGEIDIMETVNKADFISGAIHFGGEWPDNASTTGTYREGHGAKATIFADDFHIYTIEWDPTQMRWYVDGNLYSTKNNNQWWSDAATWNDRAPLDKNFYITLNLAVGGNWPGSPNSTTPFPSQMLVDWVRVYQNPNTNPTLTITYPEDGSHLPTAGNVTIEADAFDSDGTIEKVQFLARPTYLGEDTTVPYSTTWNESDGCYTLNAIAIDDLGGYAEDSIDITVGAGCPQLPFYGSPQAIPGQIEAEDFDLGINGVAYYDADAGNNGGQYRDTDVDIEACTDTGEGYNIAWISANEWLDYQVDVATAGTYTIETRVASNATGGTFHIEFNGVDKTGNISVPVTGGWQNWVTVTAYADLSAGEQEMTFVKSNSDADEFNVKYFNISGGAPCDALSIHVEDILPGTAAGSKSKKYGQVTVTINDDCGKPVFGANVNGSFSGDFTDTVSDTTDGNGQVVFTTSIEIRKPSYTFCVDDVIGSLPHASGDDVETCDSN